MFVSWCGDDGLWARCLFAHWKICKWSRSGKSIAKVLETFDNVENLCAEQRDGIASFIRRHDVLTVLPTGLFQLIPGLCVELHNLGYSYYPKNPIVIVICPLNALIECHMKQLEHRGFSCTCLSGEDADQDGAFAGRYSFIFANPEALIIFSRGFAARVFGLRPNKARTTRQKPLVLRVNKA